MKKLSQPKYLAIFCAGAGIVCMLLRFALLKTGVDDKGLILPGNICNILSWILTAVVFAAVAALLWKQRRRYLFRPNTVNTVGMLACSVGLAGAAYTLFTAEKGTFLQLFSGLLAAISVLFALLIALTRFRRLRPHVLLHLPLLVFLPIFLLLQYRIWSAEPETQRYFFSLTALVCTMLSAYQNAAAEVGIGHRKAGLFFSCCGIYLCFAAAADPGFFLLYLCMGIRLLLDTYTLVPRKIRRPQGE